MRKNQMVKLRPYQLFAIKTILKALKSTDRCLVQMPCGAGKTIVFSNLVETILKFKPDFRALILVNRNILILQTVNKFKGTVGVFNAGLGKKQLEFPITIASVQSLAKANDIPKIDLLLVDEVHSLSLGVGMGKKVYEKISNAKVIGFTATPYYPGGVPIWGLNEFFKNPPCVQLELETMTRNGFLSKLVLAGEEKKNKIDVSKVKKHKNDYIIHDLEKVYLKNEDKVKAQMKDIVERTKNRKKIAIMCVSIKHAKLAHQVLTDLELDSAVLHSAQDKTTQELNKNKFITGNAKFMVSVLMLSVGFDFPELDAIALCRPTRSRVLFMQAVGRVTRIAPGKENGLILDYGGIIEYLGHPYGVKPILNRKRKLKLKMCCACLAYNAMPAKRCETCNEIFMTMCPICASMKPYGETCLVCRSKRVSDPYKNLNVTPNRKPKFHAIEKTEIRLHTSAKGWSGPRIDYFVNCVGFDKKIASEFIFDMKLDDVKKFFKRPSGIWVLKEGGFNKIIEKEFKL